MALGESLIRKAVDPSNMSLLGILRKGRVRVQDLSGCCSGFRESVKLRRLEKEV